MSRLHMYNERLHDILSSKKGECFGRRMVSVSIIILSPSATPAQFNVLASGVVGSGAGEVDGAGKGSR